MGCDAPAGWNQGKIEYEEEEKVKGWRPGLLGEPSECLSCGALVKRNMRDTHIKFHKSLLDALSIGTNHG